MGFTRRRLRILLRRRILRRRLLRRPVPLQIRLFGGPSDTPLGDGKTTQKIVPFLI